jgi:hypothetical protein
VLVADDSVDEGEYALLIALDDQTQGLRILGTQPPHELAVVGTGLPVHGSNRKHLIAPHFDAIHERDIPGAP